MEKFNFNEFDENIADSILSQGATLRTTGEAVGNFSYLSQTKNKETFGLSRFMGIGRYSKGSPKAYFSETTIKNKQSTLHDHMSFVQKVATELANLRLFGYTIASLDFDDKIDLAKATIIFKRDVNNEEKIVQTDLIFIDENGIFDFLEKVGDTRNVIIFANKVEDDFSMMITSDRQNDTLKLSSESFDITLISETEKRAGTIYESNKGYAITSPSYYSMYSDFNQNLKNIIDADVTGYQLFVNAQNYQINNYGFSIYNGKVESVDTDKYSSDMIAQFYRAFASSFEDYQIVSRYLNNHYNKSTELVDAMLDKFAFSRSKDLSVAEAEIEFATKYFANSDIDEDDNENENIGGNIRKISLMETAKNNETNSTNTTNDEKSIIPEEDTKEEQEEISKKVSPEEALIKESKDEDEVAKAFAGYMKEDNKEEPIDDEKDKVNAKIAALVSDDTEEVREEKTEETSSEVAKQFPTPDEMLNVASSSSSNVTSSSSSSTNHSISALLNK